MKNIKTIIKICNIYLIVYLLGLIIIDKFGFRYRPWTILLTLVVVVIKIILSVRIMVKKNIFVTIISGALLTICMSISIFFYSPEYFVVKNNKKIIAVVDNSLLDTSVYYFAYRGLFFMGKYILIDEYYGSGSYNPFNSVINKQPVRIDILN